MIRLSWPAKDLSPNARKDRRNVTSVRQAAREEGFCATKEARVVILSDSHLHITFHPPDRRRRDLDNLLASIKPHLDGIAMAAGVDDAGWSFTIRKGEVLRDGEVIVTLAQPENPV